MQRHRVRPPAFWLLQPDSGVKAQRVARQLVDKQPQGLPAGDAEIKRQLREVRQDAAGHLDALRAGLAELLAAAGIAVCQAPTGAAAAGWLASTLGRPGPLVVNRSASVAEIRPELEVAGFSFVEAYDGQYERPEKGIGHYWEITPPTGEAAWEAFAARPAAPGGLEDGTVALLGVNAVSAEDGAVFFVQHLRNISETLGRAQKVILLVGLDKIVRDWAAAELVARAMARFGAASIALGVPGRGSREVEDGREAASVPPLPASLPTPPSEAPEGPKVLAPGQDVSVILLDNGRSALLADERYRELFLCIGCRACQRECPTFPYFGGSAGWKPRDYLFAFLRGANDSLSDCAQCGRCQMLCPLDIPIPYMIALCREEKEYPLRDRLYSHIHVLFLLSSRAAPLANRLFRLAPARVPVEWVAGLDRRRPLPRFYARDFEHEFRARQWPSGRKVVYYYGCYVNYTDPALGLDVARVLARNFFEPILPPPTCCGVAAYSYGDMRLAHRLAAANVRWLAEQVDRGLDIVVSCPSCALALQHHFPQILASAEAQRVAEHTLDVGAFLLREHAAGRLDTHLGPLEKVAGYHVPCHMRVRDAGRENVALLGLIPGLDVRVVDRGCCGLSGSFGLKAHNRAKSAEIGRELFSAMLDPELDLAMTDCAGCEMQIRYGTGREVAHPMRLLWQAYSAVAEIPDRLRRVE